MTANPTPKRSIRMDDDFWAQVQEQAAQQGINVSDLIRGMLREWLGDREGEK